MSFLLRSSAHHLVCRLVAELLHVLLRAACTDTRLLISLFTVLAQRLLDAGVSQLELVLQRSDDLSKKRADAALLACEFRPADYRGKVMQGVASGAVNVPGFTTREKFQFEHSGLHRAAHMLHVVLLWRHQVRVGRIKRRLCCTVWRIVLGTNCRPRFRLMRATSLCARMLWRWSSQSR